MTHPDPYQLLTREQVAEHLHCTIQYVTQLTRSGALFSRRIGRRVLVPRANLESFIRGEPVPAGDELLKMDDGQPIATPSMFDASAENTT